MCTLIVINKGEKEIETPKQFLEYFEKELIGYELETEDCCLCGYDLEKELKSLEVIYKIDCGDIYIDDFEGKRIKRIGKRIYRDTTTCKCITCQM